MQRVIGFYGFIWNGVWVFAGQIAAAGALDAGRVDPLRQVHHRVGRLGLRRRPLGDLQFRTSGTANTGTGRRTSFHRRQPFSANGFMGFFFLLCVCVCVCVWLSSRTTGTATRR